MTYHTKTAYDSLRELGTSPQGLSNVEAKKRLEKYGPNALQLKGEPLWRKLAEPFIDIFMLVLAVAVVISILHHATIDAIIIGAIMVINAVIYYVQRFSTERVLRALQKKQEQTADVIRGGETHRLEAVQLVPGDIILLEEGEKIPADARLITVESIRVDESQLTGESLPIEKQIEVIDKESEIYERSNMVYQGSFVVGGRAIAMVTATGNETQFGHIARLSTGAAERSPVQVKIDKTIKLIIRIVAGISILAFALAIYRGLGFADSIRYVLALAVSAVPESLSIAITVVLVLGMRRMAKKKALVKTMGSIESIGIVTTIATDKTGTLTENRLTLQRLWHHTRSDEEITTTIAHTVNMSKAKVHDPLDIALSVYCKKNKASFKLDEKHEKTMPFNQQLAMSGNLYTHRGSHVLWVKGAPEKIIARSNLTGSAHQSATDEVERLASEGFRVIALAKTVLKKPIDELADLPESTTFTFEGLIAVADVLRKEARRAVAIAHDAGIRVCMVTGDHFETSFRIGQELGIAETRDEVFDCRKMHNMTDKQLAKVIESTHVFARVLPENKLRLLRLLKKNHITAMTGDGVNDVPALSGAHIGIAMGGGSSIAKDAGDIILLDNNFKSIVGAVHEGRTIYANIKRMVGYLLSTNAGEVLVAIISLVLGLPIPLTPVQILWVNLVTDSSMVIPLGLEPGEKRNMHRPPQPPSAPLFSRFMLSRIGLVAATMAIASLAVFKWALGIHNLDYARTLVFHLLVVMQWASAFNFRSDYESVFLRVKRFSASFYVGLFAAVSTQLLALFTPLGDVLGLSQLAAKDIVFITLLGFIMPIAVVEIHKWIGRRYFNKGHK